MLEIDQDIQGHLGNEIVQINQKGVCLYNWMEARVAKFGP